MEFKQLETYVTIVDEGSFSAAASRLKISQSMVTVNIRNLENELGTRLLNRTTRSMELTTDGQTFYYYARQMLKLNRDSIFALMHADEGENAINIVATPYTSRHYLSGLIADFLKTTPDAHFRVTVCYNSEIHTKLAAGGFEFAFCNMQLQNADYSVKRFHRYNLIAVTPNTPKYAAIGEGYFPPELFATEPVIMRSTNSSVQQEFLNWLRDKQPDARLNFSLVIDDTETIKKVVAEGCGISVLNDVAVREELAAGKVLAFPLEDMVPHEMYFVAKKKYLTPVQAQFRDFLIERCEG